MLHTWEEGCSVVLCWWQEKNFFFFILIFFVGSITKGNVVEENYLQRSPSTCEILLNTGGGGENKNIYIKHIWLPWMSTWRPLLSHIIRNMMTIIMITITILPNFLFGNRWTIVFFSFSTVDFLLREKTW